MSSALSEPSRMPMFLKSMPNTMRGGGLQEEQHAAGDEELVDRRRVEHGPDDEVMQDDAGERDQHDADQGRDEERHAALVGVVDAVHADHHQLGVADPHDVDDAEDQVQSERQQRQQAREAAGR